MKLLIFACFLGLAAASLLQEAEPVVDETVIAFLEGSMTPGSLQKALGVSDPIFDAVENDIKTNLGEIMKNALKDMLTKINEHLDNGEGIAESFLNKAKELREKLKDLGIDSGEDVKKILELIKEKVKKILKEFLEKVGIGKRNLDDEMDEVARMKFRDFIEKIKEKILSNETIQKIRDYIRKLPSEHPVFQQLKDLVEKLKNVDLRELIKHLLEYKTGLQTRDLKDTWEKIKETLKERHIELKEKMSKFGDWLNKIWNKGLENIKDKHQLIRSLLLEFVAHAKDITAEQAREALEFFRPYKEDLGALWNQLVEVIKEKIGRF